MDKEELRSLRIGTKVKCQIGLNAPPAIGEVADIINESILVKYGHTSAGRPNLRWMHYMSLKIMEVEK